MIPADAELTPRPDALPAWDSLSESEKKLYARQMEVYAGFQENADWNIGRLLDAVEEMGELDNTLVIYIFGDNGASLEGTITGSFNELTMQNGIALTPEQQLSLIEHYGGLDAWGTDAYAPHYAAAWAWAGNTPFQWGKQVRLPPRRHAQPAWSSPGRNGSRTPAGCARSSRTASTSVRRSSKRPASPSRRSSTGSAQKPMEGTSFLYSFDDADAAGAAHRAVLRDRRQPGDLQGRLVGRLQARPHPLGRSRRRRWRGSHPEPTTPSRTRWELYYLPDDFSQANDLAAENPEKLAELKELFWQEAEKHNVLPLLAAFSVFFGILPPMPTITTQTFYGDVQNIASGMIPRIYGRSYAIEAELSVPEDGAEGVIVAEADEMGGFSLWVDENGLLHHSYSMMGVEQLQAGLDRADPDRGRHGPHAVRRRPAGTVGRRNRLPVRERREDRRGTDREDGLRPLLRLRGMDIGRDNGLRRRPRLRGQGAVPLHRHGEEGRLRPQAGQPRRREGAARGRARTSPPRTASAPSRVRSASAAGGSVLTRAGE